MADILFHYERVNPTSWAYISSLLMLALYFKFNRVWSVRNLDLFLLILLSPGLLLVQYSWENAGLEKDVSTIEYFGFIWLFVAGGLLLLRLLFDSAMVRRPLLEPNLNAAGLLFMGSSLLFFLMANVVTGVPTPNDLSPAQTAEEIGAEQADEVRSDTFATDGPGFWLVYLLPRISTQKVIEDGLSQGEVTPRAEAEQEQLVRETTARVMSILSHLMIVIGMLIIGAKHFGSLTIGLGAATMYILLPYTALWTGSVEHALPGALLLWAIVWYRHPLLSGMMVGLASGTIYYPAFLIFLWCSYYWQRGVKRFVTGVLLMIAVLVATLAFTSTSPDQFVAQLMQMFGLRLPSTEELGGIWKYGDPVYRLSVLAAFVALSAGFAIWPTRKNLATLISCTAAIMVGAQFWHAYGGGVFVAWYLPLLLLTIFRPNLEESVAVTMVRKGWWSQRQQRQVEPAQPQQGGVS